MQFNRLVSKSVLVFLFFSCVLAGVALSGSVPTNVILLISDGMGYNHMLAADFFQYGLTGYQPYQSFPIQISMRTFSHGGAYDPEMAATQFEYVKENPTDSAAAATAMASGFKVPNGQICVDNQGQALLNCADVAEQAGKSSGVITSVPLSHATPAGFSAHNISRKNVAEIATELFEHSALDVVMGAGHPYYNDNGEVQEQPLGFDYVGGEAMWNRLKAGEVGNDANGDGLPNPWYLIEYREQFQALATGPTPDRVVGVPTVHSTLQLGRDGQSDRPFDVPFTPHVPTLAEMTRAALNVLDNNPQGFFLMVEGGAVDWASHANQKARMIEEQIDFNLAVAAVVDWVELNSNWDETLVIVTADHECGYLTRSGADAPDNSTVQASRFGVVPEMQWNSTHHTNSLVPFYAKGSGSEQFPKQVLGQHSWRGDFIDNTAIAKVLFGLWGAAPGALASTAGQETSEQAKP